MAICKRFVNGVIKKKAINTDNFLNFVKDALLYLRFLLSFVI